MFENVVILGFRCPNKAFYVVSLFTSLSILGSSNLLQILRKLAAFSFAALCIIVFKLSGNSRSLAFDILLQSCPCTLSCLARDIISTELIQNRILPESDILGIVKQRVKSSGLLCRFLNSL